MARGIQLTDEKRAQVIAALAAGDGVREVSRRLDVPVSTVSRLKNETMPKVLRESVPPVETPDEPIGFIPIDDDEGALIDAEFERQHQREQLADECEMDPGTLANLEQVGTQKKSLHQLVADLLTENLLTLAAHAKMSRDPKWFARQGAEAMGIFDGVMSDKTIRILEAAAAAQPLDNGN
jgi:DNA-binding transcriptional ArsR family regulator